MGEGKAAIPYTAYVANRSDAPAYWQVGILWVMLATGDQSGGNYSLMWQLCPKNSGPSPHYHDQDEQFYILDGQITYVAGDRTLVATAGAFVLIPRGTVHCFRVDSETAIVLNSYTPAGFEQAIIALGEAAAARTLPPVDRPMIAHPERAAEVFDRIGMHLVDAPDVLREGAVPDWGDASRRGDGESGEREGA